MDRIPDAFAPVVEFGPGERFVSCVHAAAFDPDELERAGRSWNAPRPNTNTGQGLLLLSDFRLRFFFLEQPPGRLMSFVPRELREREVPLGKVEQVQVDKMPSVLMPILVLHVRDHGTVRERCFFIDPRDPIQPFFDKVVTAAELAGARLQGEGLEGEARPPPPPRSDPEEGFIRFNAQDDLE